MPLQQSGPIKMSDIKTEVNSSSNSLREYSSKAGKSAPDSLMEFLGYTYSGVTTTSTTTTTTTTTTTSTTTTQPVMTELTIGWSVLGGAEACTQKAAGGNYTIKLLGSGATLAQGIIIYVSYYPQKAAAGYYSDGTSYWFFDGTNPTSAATTCPAPTTTTSTTTTTTTTTTLGPWTVARLSVASAEAVCNGTADMTSISVSGGTNITDATNITILNQTSTFDNLIGNNEPFWIYQKNGAIFYSRKYRKTGATTATALEAAVECGAATTTEASTTAAPTTAATTAAPTTYSVTLYGKRQGAITTLLYYGINDTSCPDGGYSVTGTGAAKTTFNVAAGAIVYVTMRNASDGNAAFDAQIGADVYGTPTCPASNYVGFTINSNTNISVIGDARIECP